VNKKGAILVAPRITPMDLMVKETQYRKTMDEKVGLTKIENMIEIRHSKITARFVFSQGMVSPNTPRVNRKKHLSSTEKIEATRRFLNDPANEKRIEHPFDIPGNIMKRVGNREKKVDGLAWRTWS
jgi:hypothetical protein